MMKEIATMWEYKVDSDAIIANFVCCEKVDYKDWHILKRQHAANI